MQLALWNHTADDEQSGVRPRPTAPPRPAAPNVPRADRAARASERPNALTVDELAARAGKYVEEAHAARTRRAYQTDWTAFERWCTEHGVCALPASTSSLALYLTHLAECGKKASTIRRARIAIGQAHAHAGAPRPDRDGRIRTLERGIGRVHGTKEEGATPLLDEELARAVAALGRSPRAERDRAMLLLGFAGAFRCSELSGLNVEDVCFTADGLEVRVRRSKEDQLGRGATTLIPHGAREATCPVRALKTWLHRVGRPSGPLFRVIRGANIEHQRVHPKAVTRAVQRAVELADLKGHYSSHSLRVGLATSAYAHGATRREIQIHGRWQDPRSVERYLRIEQVPGRRNVAEGLL